MDDLRSLPCLILGAGGHAAVVIDAMVTAGLPRPVAALDRDPSRWGKDVLGVPIRGGDDLIAELVRVGVSGFLVGVGGVGDNGPRRGLFDLGVRSTLRPITVVHPAAICSTSARLGAGTVVLPGAVVNAGALLGQNVIINTGAIVEHDCVISDHVHVASGATLASSVRVGEGAHIGAGAVVRQELSIGSGAIVGVGAVVVKDVEAARVVVGVPARPWPAGRSGARR